MGIAGPLLGGHPGWVVSQGERLAANLARDGVAVRATSDRIGRLRRALDTGRTVRSWRAEVDVIVVMVFSGPAFAIADLTTRVAAGAGLPIVLWLHGGNLPAFARRRPRWTRQVLRRADAVVAPSSYLAELYPLARRADGRRPRAETLPNIIPDPCALPVPRSRGARLLWMRTFHPLYHPEDAVRVLAELHATVPDATLTMAGQDRGGRNAVRALAAELGVADAVAFPGFLGEEAKAAAFADHDVFLNTSVVDNAPVSLLEAAAHGLVLVSTPTGGIPALFPDEEAALYGATPAQLARQIRRVIEDPGLSHRLATTGHDRALDGTWARVGPRWHALLVEVADRG